MIQDRPVLQNEMHCPLLNQHRPWFVTYLHAHPFILNVWNDTSNDRQVVCQSVSSLSWILETHMRIFLKKILVNTSSLSSPANRKRLSKYSSWMAHGPRVDRCCQRERAQEKTEQFVLEYFLSAMVDCRPEATISRGLQLPSSTRAAAAEWSYFDRHLVFCILVIFFWHSGSHEGRPPDPRHWFFAPQACSALVC